MRYAEEPRDPWAFAVTVAMIVASGVLVGTFWWALAPTVAGTALGDGVIPTETAPRGFAIADAHFAAWTSAAALLWAVRLRRRWAQTPVWGLLALVLGTTGAAAVAALVGLALGPAIAPDVQPGTPIEAPLRLLAPGWLLAGAIVGVGYWFVRDFIDAWRSDALDEQSVPGELASPAPGPRD